MRLQIRRVKQPSAIRFDEQRVRVERAMVVEEWRDGEGTQCEWFSVANVTGWLEPDARREERRFLQNPARCSSDVNGHLRRHLLDESPVILMSMRENENQERLIV